MIRRLSSISRATTTQPPTVNFNGVWKNELGSQMDIQVSQGAVTGKYQTGVGSPAPVELFDLVGFVAGDLISFTVNFGKYGSLTSWVGQHTLDSGGKEVIKTMWLLAENVVDSQEPAKLWGATLTGANEFRR